MASCEKSSCEQGTINVNPQRIKVMFVCDEWKSTKGGLSTTNRQFAINVAKTCPNIEVYCYVAKSDEGDRKDARKNGVTLLTAKKVPGHRNCNEWLKFPPAELQCPDVVVGHGRKFGSPAYFIMEKTNCKWIQIQHVFCLDLGKHKSSKGCDDLPAIDHIEDNELKHQDEVELCEAADAVFAVGIKLLRKYRKVLPEALVEVITPGIFDNFPLYEPSENRLAELDKDGVFDILMFGRAAFEDRKLKGFDIVAKAVACLGPKFRLTFVGSQSGGHTKLEEWFCSKTEISKEQLTVHGYMDQEEMKKMLKTKDLVVLPSREEAFGMGALEAISRGIPLLVTKKSGIADALREVEGGDAVIVENNNVKEWAARIQQLSNQTSRERYENARHLRENYHKTYTWEQECRKFGIVVENLASVGDQKENVGRPLPNEGSPAQKVSQGKKRKHSEIGASKDLEYCKPINVQAALHGYVGQIFGKRSATESRAMRWGDITLKSTQGTERLALTVAGSETQRSDELQTKAVDCYKIFRSHRPKEMNNPNSPFYLAVKNKKKEDPEWYMKVPQGIRKIGKMRSLVPFLLEPPEIFKCL